VPNEKSRPKSILVIGESWFTHSIHVKGFDSFATSTYEEGCGAFCQALEQAGWLVTHIPCHLVETEMPVTLADLQRYHAVVLSDIGTNTFALGRATFQQGRPSPDRLDLLKEYVAVGGGLLMVGGYMSFSGIEGKAGFGRSPLASVLPVVIASGDDRVERPAGARPVVVDPNHPMVRDLTGVWPEVLGYNRLTARAGASIIVECEQRPFLVADDYGRGRVAAFASDMGPHWAPAQFMTWSGYGVLWNSVMSWLGRV
jgi:uncharacterized membrane protein